MFATMEKILEQLNTLIKLTEGLLINIKLKVFIYLSNEKNIFFIWFIKNKKFIFAMLILIFIIFFFYCFGYLKRDEEVKKVFIENEEYVLELNLKEKENKELNEKLQGVLTSKDYLIYKIFKSSGIRVPTNVPQGHLQTMYDEAIKNKIPVRIFFRVIQSESEFNSKAYNGSGASGYMQLMPEAYNRYSHKLRLKKSPETNIKAGALYLKDLYTYWDKRVSGNEHRKWSLALASYNAGIDNVIRNREIPNNGVTPRYVNFILN